jgi:hypothetical protein
MIARVRKGFRRIGFRFDALSVLLLCEKYDIEIDQLDKIPKSEYLTAWMWCAHRSYRLRQNRRTWIGFNKMKRIGERMRMSDWRAINEAMVKASPPAGDSDKKKEQPGMTSTSQGTGQDYVSSSS